MADFMAAQDSLEKQHRDEMSAVVVLNRDSSCVIGSVESSSSIDSSCSGDSSAESSDIYDVSICLSSMSASPLHQRKSIRSAGRTGSGNVSGGGSGSDSFTFSGGLSGRAYDEGRVRFRTTSGGSIDVRSSEYSFSSVNSSRDVDNSGEYSYSEDDG